MLDIKHINYMPTIEDIDKYIGTSLFMEFYNYMNDEYKAICKIEYSKDSLLRGWNLKFRKAGKGLCVVYPKDRYFTLLVVVGKKEKEKVESLLPELTKTMQEIYDTTKEGMGQRWLMIDLYSNDDIYQDTLKLIKIRRICK